MKNLIYIFILISFLGYSQTPKVTRKGYWRVMVGDSLVSNHSDQNIAVTKGIGLSLRGLEGVWVKPIDRIEITSTSAATSPNYLPEIPDSDIEIRNITNSSVEIVLHTDIKDISFGYIEFFLPGEHKEQTTRGLDRIYSFNELKSNSDYYFTVYLIMMDGSVKASNILNFKTQ